MKSPNIQKLPIALLSKAELICKILDAIASSTPTTIGHVNLHGLYWFLKDPIVNKFFASAFNYIDGTPIVWILRLLGYPARIEHRNTLLDWLHPLLSKLQEQNRRLFILGGTQESLRRGVENLKKQYPSLQVAYHHGYFKKEPGSSENEEVLRLINAQDPQIVFVGLGMPAQEQWVQRNRESIRSAVVITVGGIIDYLSGEIKTPPRWLGPFGLEWSFRLFTSPQRMFKRYFVEPFQILWLLIEKNPKARQFSIMATSAIFLLTFALFAIFPSHTAQSLFHFTLSSWQQSITLLLSLIFFSLTLALMSFETRENSTLSDSTSLQRINNISRITSICVLGILFLLLVRELQNPLSWDEHISGSLISQQGFGIVESMRLGRVECTTILHPIAVMSAVVSKTFLGMSSLAIRIPSILFAIGFFLFVFSLVPSTLSYFVYCGLILHLSTNKIFLSHMSSSRGYASAVAIGCSLYLCLIYLSKKENYSKKTLALIAALSVTSVFTLIAALYFNLILGITCVVWALAQKSKKEKKVFFILGAIFLSTVLFGKYLYAPLLTPMAPGCPTPDPFPPWMFWGMPGMLLGIPTMVYAKLFFVFFILLLAIGIRLNRKRTFSEFFVVTAIVITLILAALKGRAYPTRYFLLFLIPIILTFLESLEKIFLSLRASSRAWIAVIIASLFLIGLPFFYHHEVTQSLENKARPFAHIIHLIAKEVRDADRNYCLNVFVPSKEADWLRHIYFPAAGDCLKINEWELTSLQSDHRKQIIFQDEANHYLILAEEKNHTGVKP